jgi:hypothetical protein
MLDKLIIAANAVVFSGLFAFVASRPSDFKYQQSAPLTAPPGAVFAQLVDFHNWAAWSPLEKLDPSMKKEFSGPASGVGSSFHWAGNAEVGEGRMTIVSQKSDAEVVIKLELLEPFEAAGTTTFALSTASSGTYVVWAVTGTHGFAMKARTVFTNFEKTLREHLDRGLTGLDDVSKNMKQMRGTSCYSSY